jgi:hypothetical protein
MTGNRFACNDILFMPRILEAVVIQSSIQVAHKAKREYQIRFRESLGHNDREDGTYQHTTRQCDLILVVGHE